MTDNNDPYGYPATVYCGDNEYILDAAEDDGHDYNYSCRAGACSTCVSQQWEGEPVDQAEQTFLTDEQVDDGWVLICVAYPTSSCSIKANMEEWFPNY
ncbi:MAG: 2Fe-2S iron-sulfur cluster binding domain-containing protein [Bacteroidales bacterium]|nr:2Fe-2S iron-sulfur cluster binding domain-containing protein [Bacteroidales bacterium]MCF8389158.1 2Fe-2S iron-sulfur cluster binding domain-containing protein [Bacteroidales bacterium]